MATLALGLVGTAIGASIGGGIPILGATLTATSIGGMVGATIGGYIDNMIIASLTPAIRNEGPRLQEITVMQSTEGAVVGQLYGIMRVGGNLIWSSRFKETKTTESEEVGGKGGGGGQKVETTTYTYSCSFAVAFGEGNDRVQLGRLWMDGKEIDLSVVQSTFYQGTETQGADSVIQGIEGAANTPAFRGTCYIVFEDFELADYSNRIPQVTAEIIAPIETSDPDDISNIGRSFCLIPGSGEFVYGTDIYTLQNASSSLLSSIFGGTGSFTNNVGDVLSLPNRSGANISAQYMNMHNQRGDSDFVRSMTQLELFQPNLDAILLVVGWFGDDLRIGECELKPYVEFKDRHGVVTPREWNVAGYVRSDADIPEVGRDSDDNPIYGGTPSDDVVVEAIQWLKARGHRVIFYPFIFMHIEEGNTLPDPYSDNAAGVGQPVFPWRGRITCSPAPGYVGTVDQTATAATQVNTFFTRTWGFNNMVEHYAQLCADAGGVDGFLIGTEMVEMNRIRSAASTYPSVSHLKTLAATVSGIMGSGTLVSYAADWSEYHSHRPADGSNDIYYPLDELWADSNIDFVGIDNYLPLSDWRDGSSHLDYDADAGIVTPHNITYLKSNIEGGEYYDWFYESSANRDNQTRTTIDDGGFVAATPDYTHSQGSITDASFGGAATRTADVTFKAVVPLPESPSDGGLFERGGSGQGTWLGVRDSGTVFRFRSGDGSVTSESSDTAFLDIPIEQLPFDGEEHELVWDIRIAAPGRIRLWVDEKLVGVAYTTSGALDNNSWAGSGSGAYGTATTTNMSGEPTSGWPVSCDNDLEQYTAIAAPNNVIPEDYIYRQKDIRNWWGSEHYPRPGGTRSGTATSWEPGSKPIWFTEFGCPCVDKGTNQPNVFYDPKSSESFFPYYSTGLQDEYISRVYAEAMLAYWRDNSPPGMLDIDNMFIWTWDARPFPDYPNRLDVWSDGDLHRYGHWMTGRIAYPALPRLIENLCELVGITDYDTERLNGTRGLVKGYYIDRVTAVRDIIASLMTGFQFDAFESEGKIKFALKATTSLTALSSDGFVSTESDVTGFTITRTQDTELPKRVIVDFIDADNDYEMSSLDAKRHQTTNVETSSIQLPQSLAPDYVRGLADSILHQAWVARENGAVNLPPSMFKLDPGDGITFPIGESGRVGQGRIQSIENGEFREVSFVGFDLSLYQLPVYPQQVKSSILTQVPGFPELVVLDIPLYSGDEPSHWSPRLAAYASPWPGTVAVYRDEDPDVGTEDWILGRSLNLENVIGSLVDAVGTGKTGVWERSQTITVNLLGGTLPSADSDIRVLNGDNVCAMQNDQGHWEIFQYKTATLNGDGHYELTSLIRGQLGTEWVMDEATFSAGNTFVLLENQFSINPSTAPYLPLTAGDRDVEHYLRFGSAYKSVEDDNAYLETSFTHEAMAKKPYSPVQLKAKWNLSVNNDIELSWIRRTRFDGDPWELASIPLNEEVEEYELEILNGSTVVREVTGLSSPAYTYTDAMQVADFGSAQTSSIKIRVYQMSTSVGRGIPAEETLNR